MGTKNLRPAPAHCSRCGAVMRFAWHAAKYDQVTGKAILWPRWSCVKASVKTIKDPEHDILDASMLDAGFDIPEQMRAALRGMGMKNY